MQRKFSFEEGEMYHLYNRGANKQPIFVNDHDRFRLLILLYCCNGTKEFHISNHKSLSLEEYFLIDRGEPIVEILAYCLMPNHFHLLVKEITKGGISLFMQKVLTGYGMYYNAKHSRTGPLFEGRFKAQHVDSDEYLEYLLAYIHLNPIKTKDEESWSGKKIVDPVLAKEFLSNYRFSSYPNFLGKSRVEDPILNLSDLPQDIVSEQKNVSELIKIWSAEILED
ncbi:MAG: hypothetical protein A2556_02220 [Candidatus Vogelbacteria bacterium RIFOXYD2_FULL_44_9]|uniref:Transposase IS200-like domain-containing protein n=1 Tax=Candidatus Vogelbacteria bacterium RIFOXYD2_FULL_44_9 TaxID=1802441 RepID=A0A1G2QLW6_9BACT|nr:MAG: hypothetical protein A2556_02220 [Candidatus Vogelbacteria bacterium RIFOXYD2_FULL_44_9]